MSGKWKKWLKYHAAHLRVGFDFAFGILLPLLCIIADHIYHFGIFTPDGLLEGIFWKYNTYCYTEIIIGIVALGYFLFFGRLSIVLAGALLASGVFSFCLGIVMLPFSLIGLLVGIGIFGFTPFASSFVFFRNARRCWSQLLQHSPQKSPRSFAAAAFFIGAIILVVPAIPELSANSSIDSIHVFDPD
jgi:hypothetical protein